MFCFFHIFAEEESWNRTRFGATCEGAGAGAVTQSEDCLPLHVRGGGSIGIVWNSVLYKRCGSPENYFLFCIFAGRANLSFHGKARGRDEGELRGSRAFYRYSQVKEHLSYFFPHFYRSGIELAQDLVLHEKCAICTPTEGSRFRPARRKECVQSAEFGL